MTVVVNTQRKLVEIAYEVGDSFAHSPVIVVEATGSAEDVHTTGDRPNTGLAVLAYPSDFSGSSSIRVLDAAGGVIDTGSISV